MVGFLTPVPNQTLCKVLCLFHHPLRATRAAYLWSILYPVHHISLQRWLKRYLEMVPLRSKMEIIVGDYCGSAAVVVPCSLPYVDRYEVYCLDMAALTFVPPVPPHQNKFNTQNREIKMMLKCWGSCTCPLFSLNVPSWEYIYCIYIPVSKESNSCILLSWHLPSSAILHNKVNTVFVAHWFSGSESRSHFMSELEDFIKLCMGFKLNMSQLDMKIVAPF